MLRMPTHQLHISVTSDKCFEQVYKISTDVKCDKLLSKHIRLYTDVTCDKNFEEACEIRTDVIAYQIYTDFDVEGNVETFTDFIKGCSSIQIGFDPHRQIGSDFTLTLLTSIHTIIILILCDRINHYK